MCACMFPSRISEPKVLKFVWFEVFEWLMFTGLKGAKTKMLAIKITATAATVIKTISGVESSLFEAGFTETEDAGVNATA